MYYFQKVRAVCGVCAVQCSAVCVHVRARACVCVRVRVRVHVLPCVFLEGVVCVVFVCDSCDVRACAVNVVVAFVCDIFGWALCTH